MSTILQNKTIILGMGYDDIICESIFEVTNDKDTYILINTNKTYIIKIYMNFEEIDNLISVLSKKDKIDMRNFIDKIFIIKNNKEIPLTKKEML